MLLGLTVDFRRTAPWSAVFWEGSHHPTRCFWQTRLQLFICPQLLSNFPFCTLSSPKLLHTNCYPLEFSVLIQFPIFSHLCYLIASLSMKKLPSVLPTSFSLSENPQAGSTPFFNLHSRTKLRLSDFFNLIRVDFSVSDCSFLSPPKRLIGFRMKCYCQTSCHFPCSLWRLCQCVS